MEDVGTWGDLRAGTAKFIALLGCVQGNAILVPRACQAHADERLANLSQSQGPTDSGSCRSGCWGGSSSRRQIWAKDGSNGVHTPHGMSSWTRICMCSV